MLAACARFWLVPTWRLTLPHCMLACACGKKRRTTELGRRETNTEKNIERLLEDVKDTFGEMVATNKEMVAATKMRVGVRPGLCAS